MHCFSSSAASQWPRGEKLTFDDQFNYTRSAKWFHAETGELVASFDKHERAVGGITCHEHGPVSLDGTGELRLWSDDSGSVRTNLGGFNRFLQRITGYESQLLIPQPKSVRRIGRRVRRRMDSHWEQ